MLGRSRYSQSAYGRLRDKIREQKSAKKKIKQLI